MNLECKRVTLMNDVAIALISVQLETCHRLQKKKNLFEMNTIAIVVLLAVIAIGWQCVRNLYLNFTCMKNSYVHVERRTLIVDDLPASLDGLKVATLTDIHWNSNARRPLQMTSRLIERAVDVVNELKPDIVAHLGDFIQRDVECIDSLSAKLARLDALQIGVLGNHCHKLRRGARVSQSLERIGGVTVLENSTVYVGRSSEHDDGRVVVIADRGKNDTDVLAVVGLGDLSSGKFRPDRAFDAIVGDGDGVPRLALSHHPETFKRIDARHRLDVMLSGHTHGGQFVMFGGWSPLPLLSSIAHSLPEPLRRVVLKRGGFLRYLDDPRLLRGHHISDDGRQLYVCSGLGSHFGVRFNRPPQVSLLELKRRTTEKT
jgi:uncharacterized protein